MLALWACFPLFGLGSAGPAAVIWLVSGFLTCLAGLAVVVGRMRVGRGNTWRGALVAAAASILGPLSIALLLSSPIRRSLRAAPAQLRGEVREASAPAEEPAAVAHRRGQSLALGLAASTLAFWCGVFVSVWLALASSTLTDGAWFALSVVVVMVVGLIGFVGVLVARRRPRALERIELAAAGGMVAAIVCIALDGGDLHWSDGNRVNVSFVYGVWALIAILFAWAAIVARPRPS